MITPVYVPPTKQTIAKTKSKPEGDKNPCDDEENCVPGSGSGEVTDLYSTTAGTTKADSKGNLSSLSISLRVRNYFNEFFISFRFKS